MKTDAISILIPAYNEEKNIVSLLTDLYAQDLGDFAQVALLVLVNRATDRTQQVAAQFIQASSPKNITPRVVELASREKSQALNVGLGLSNSPIIISMDADCRLKDPKLLKQVYQFLTQNETYYLVGVLDTPDYFWLDKQSLLYKFLRAQEIAREERGRVYPIGRFMAYRRALITEGFPSSLHSEDIWLALKTAQQFGWEAIKVLTSLQISFLPPATWHEYLMQETRFLNGMQQLFERFPELMAYHKIRRNYSTSDWLQIRHRTLQRLAAENIPHQYFEFLFGGLWDQIVVENSKITNLLDANGGWAPILSTKRAHTAEIPPEI